MRRAAALLLCPALCAAMCPGLGAPPAGHPMVPGMRGGMRKSAPTARFSDSGITDDEYERRLAALNWTAVQDDIRNMLLDSKDFWPADFGSYGGLMVRQAWHCSGSYRIFDGRGGCDGGHQRFEPERSWADNTNLDKARALLTPIKLKYGTALSWGDLQILSGTVAIEAMGGPVLGFCGGRRDDPDGFWSTALGPSQTQDQAFPCPTNGECKSPLGSTTIGLIYLNPEGPMGNPDPVGSARDIRDAFGRMAMNDSETVALIGGGHTFGKPHGACPKGAGPAPKDDPANPWPGLCGTGKGADAYTSGFEFQWTPNPVGWNNDYFKLLVDYQWEKFRGPGGHWQWRIVNATGDEAKLGMLTSDIGLLNDPEGVYQEIVRDWATDAGAARFDHAFKHAWYKLTTRDMGPVTRCKGDMVPPAQPFQNPLPPPPAVPPNYTAVRAAIGGLFGPTSSSMPSGTATVGEFVRLAWQCSATYRFTDRQGGCNGARIRHEPEKDWPINAGLDTTLEKLWVVKAQFGDNLSWSDLIVLAGTVALERAGAPPIAFCHGRTDAPNGEGSRYLNPDHPARPDVNVHASMIGGATFKLNLALETMDFTQREITVLIGGGHAIGRMHPDKTGYNGSWTGQEGVLSNAYFKNLLLEQWEEHNVSATGKQQYKAKGKELYMLNSDLMLRIDAEYLAIAEDYASDNDLFLHDFAEAWLKLVNHDHFDTNIPHRCDM